MKNLILILIVLVLSGCAVIKEQEVYIQNINVKGPIHLPPMPLLDKLSENKVVITPKISFNPSVPIKGNLMHSKVNTNGIYQLDTVGSDYRESFNNKYEFKGENFNWDMPLYSAGLDFQLPLANNLNFNFGINYSDYLNTNLLGGNAGFSFFSIRENNSTVFSFGLHVQELYYEANTVVKTVWEHYNGSESTDIILYYDKDKEYTYNVYATFMFNYYFKFIKFNFAASFFTQSPFNFTPGKIDEYYYPFGSFTEKQTKKISDYVTFVAITPGLYTYMTDEIRLFGQLNLLYNISENGINHSSVILIPTVKMDFIF